MTPWTLSNESQLTVDSSRRIKMFCKIGRNNILLVSVQNFARCLCIILTAAICKDAYDCEKVYKKIQRIWNYLEISCCMLNIPAFACTANRTWCRNISRLLKTLPPFSCTFTCVGFYQVRIEVHWLRGPVNRSNHLRMKIAIEMFLITFLVLPVIVPGSFRRGFGLHLDFWAQ